MFESHVCDNHRLIFSKHTPSSYHSLTMSSFTQRFFFFFLIVGLSNANRQETADFVPTNENFLQKHISFFDRDRDGVIYPTETYESLRAIGFSIGMAGTSSLLIHKTLSFKTRSGKYSLLKLPIEIENVNKAKHTSDTGVYDSEGRFVAAKFEEIFSKHAKSNPNALTEDELTAMIAANKQPNDNEGWLASTSEWKTLFNIAKDKKGLLQKATIKDVYDGSLFIRMEKEHKMPKLPLPPQNRSS